MPQLMISLDKKILEKESGVAKRMLAIADVHHELLILIPSETQKTVRLDDRVTAIGTGGSKVSQFVRLLRRGKTFLAARPEASITCQDPFFTGLAGWILAVFFGSPLEIQVHGDFFGSPYYRKSIGWKAKLLLGEFLLRRANTIRVVSQRVAETVDHFGDAIRIDPVMVDQEQLKKNKPAFDVHDTYGKDAFIYLAIGRMEPVKQLGYLIQLFAQHVLPKRKDAVLLLVGDGSQSDKLHSQIERMNLSRHIKMESWTSDPYSYIQTADCVVIASATESYCLTAVESIALGTPVVMHDVGVARYEVKPSDTVQIVPVNDAQAFADAMNRV